MNFLTETSGPLHAEPVSERWIFDRLEDWAQRFPERLAFVMDHPGRSEEYRYSDVVRIAQEVAAALAGWGIQPGDRVGILMENIPHWVLVLMGVMRLGAVAVPLATTLPENAIRNLAVHAGCVLIFADEPNIEKASSVAGAAGSKVVRIGGAHPSVLAWEEFLQKAGAVPPFPSGVNRIALIIYTSGTTGDPKGVQLTARNLACEILGVSEAFALSDAHRILSVLPFSHVLPLIANGLGPLCIGATVVFLSTVSPQRITEAFQRHRITFFVCVPQFFYMLHKRIFAQIGAQSFSARRLFRLTFRIAAYLPQISLRRRLFGRIHRAVGPDLTLLASGGSRFDPGIAADLERLGYTTLQAYGLTETSAAATATPARNNVIGSVGRPIRGVSIRIDSPDANGVGEVWIGGPIVMAGYYRATADSDRVMTDGWFHSGDLGYLRSDGNLVITGRSKDVIVLANGKNVYPEELEAHYAQTRFVKELCIIGVTGGGDSPEGEKLHAIVVPDMDEFRRVGQIRIIETIRFELENLSRQLPSYQHILSLTIRNEPFPRTDTRKLKRFEIRQEYDSAPASSAPPDWTPDDPVFQEGVGAAVAALVRQFKPDASGLRPDTNIELELGFDSLTRVELLGLAESQLGIRVDEKAASRVFTLKELVELLSVSGGMEGGRGRSWKEILESAPDAEIAGHEVFSKSEIRKFGGYIAIKLARILFLVIFRLRFSGVEKVPRQLPFILCPNHESFLDGPLLISLLPRNVISNILILGYTDYWKTPIMKKAARFANIVPIDPNVNLVRAMQVGAAGLRRKRVLLIFPEGLRSIDGVIGPFKKGAAILAMELGVPIVPIGLRGAHEMWPRGGRFRLHPVEIRFGNPLDPKTFAGASDPYAAMTAVLRDEVRRLAGK